MADKLGFFILVISIFFSGNGFALEPGEKSFIFKSRENELVRFENYQGSIDLEGWNQDRIRVTASVWGGEGPLPQWPQDFSVEEEPYLNGIRIRIVASKGKEILEKLKLRKNSWFPHVHLLINAPAHRPVEVRAGEGNISVKGWRQKISVSSMGGNIALEDLVGGDFVEVLAPKGNVSLLDSKAKRFKVVSGLNSINIRNLIGDWGYVDSRGGDLYLEGSQIQEMEMVVGSGQLSVVDFVGNLRFFGGDGKISLSNLAGGASGTTKGGAIELKAKRWRPTDFSYFETQSGNISLDFPNDFRGQLDLETRSFDLAVEFPGQRLPLPHLYGPVPPGKWYGVVREKGQVVRVRSLQGGIRVF